MCSSDLAQSFISIDNVGIAVWGWILGGLIAGISVVEVDAPTSNSQINSKKQQKVRVRKQESIAQPLVSGIAATVAIAIVIPLFLADSAARTSRTYIKPVSSQASAYLAAVKKPLTYGFKDPANELLAGQLLAQAGLTEEGTSILKDLAASDSQNYGAFDVLASIYEQTNKPAEAIPFRKRTIELDPFNKNIVAKLDQDLKASGK